MEKRKKSDWKWKPNNSLSNLSHNGWENKSRLKISSLFYFVMKPRLDLVKNGTNMFNIQSIWIETKWWGEEEKDYLEIIIQLHFESLEHILQYFWSRWRAKSWNESLVTKTNKQQNRIEEKTQKKKIQQNS